TEFPASLHTESSSATRTRVALMPAVGPEVKLQFLMNRLNPPEQAAYAKRALAVDPRDALALSWLTGTMLKPDEALDFLAARLADRPALVEWHRAYQSLM